MIDRLRALALLAGVLLPVAFSASACRLPVDSGPDLQAVVFGREYEAEVAALHPKLSLERALKGSREEARRRKVDLRKFKAPYVSVSNYGQPSDPRVIWFILYDLKARDGELIPFHSEFTVLIDDLTGAPAKPSKASGD